MAEIVRGRSSASKRSVDAILDQLVDVGFAHDSARTAKLAGALVDEGYETREEFETLVRKQDWRRQLADPKIGFKNGDLLKVEIAFKLPAEGVPPLLAAKSDPVPSGREPSAGSPRSPHPRAPDLQVNSVAGEYRTCLDKPYVQKELRWARQYEKKVIVVFEAEERRASHFDHGKAMAKYKGTEWEDILNIDAIPYRRDEDEAEVMIAKILRKADGAQAPVPAENPRNPPGVWDFFLSHAQATGGDQTQTTSLRLVAKEKHVWYDNAMNDRSTAAMKEGVKCCCCVVLFLTGEAVAATALAGTPKPDPDPDPADPDPELELQLELQLEPQPELEPEPETETEPEIGLSLAQFIAFDEYMFGHAWCQQRAEKQCEAPRRQGLCGACPCGRSAHISRADEANRERRERYRCKLHDTGKLAFEKRRLSDGLDAIDLRNPEDWDEDWEDWLRQTFFLYRSLPGPGRKSRVTSPRGESIPVLGSFLMLQFMEDHHLMCGTNQDAAWLRYVSEVNRAIQELQATQIFLARFSGTMSEGERAIMTRSLREKDKHLPWREFCSRNEWKQTPAWAKAQVQAVPPQRVLSSVPEEAGA
jgi:hypothetical protein